jgi:peroxiredoxin Q/BCP
VHRLASFTLVPLLVALSALTSACRREPPPPPAPGATSATPAGDGELAVGSAAPALHATAHDGTVIDLAELRGKRVVLYFYPKDETPGCTAEACAFRDAWTDLAKTGTVLVGLSSDSLESHRKFAEHHKLPFHLVSDESGSIAKSYGVPNRAGFFARQSFVIGKDGRIEKIYRSVDVSTHARQILGDVSS